MDVTRVAAAWRRIALMTVAGTCLGGGIASPCEAQARLIVARDAEARMERLAEGIFAIIHDDATTDWRTGITEWPHGNTGVIVGDDAVLVVDATYLPARALADIALIRSVTTKPVRYLVNTHWHGDHTHGNGVYRDQFPGLVIVGQEANRDWIATNLARYPALVANGTKRPAIDALRKLLEAGRDSSGIALSAPQKVTIADNIKRREHEISEFAKIQIVPPTLLFHDRMVIVVGGRRVELQNRGRANSPADVTVYLPDEKILFAGDIVVYPIPYVGASHPLPWIDVLEELERVPMTALVPGHGRILSDYAYVGLLRELFETTRDRVRSAMEQGTPLAEMVRTMTLADMRERFMKLGERNVAGEWDGTPEVLVERMHQCVQGYRC